MHTQSSNIRPAYDHYSHSIGSNQTTNHDNRDINRSHPKLQRQLSLNPNACDPRIQQRVQNANTINRQMAQAEQQHLVHHRLLSGSLSGPRSPNMSNHWDVHQVSIESFFHDLHYRSQNRSDIHVNKFYFFAIQQSLTRIASAPVPSEPWHTSNQSQPPQVVTDILTPWTQTNNIPLTAPSNLQKQNTVNTSQANRSHIHYHLSSIFPEEQVLTVMQMYPEETNPQNICAAILNIFPRV